MFQELSWFPINNRSKYNKAVFTYKALNNLTPQYITDLLKPISDAHTRTLRSSVSGALAVPRSRTSLFDRSYSYSAPKLWNSIPISVRNSATPSSFKEGGSNEYPQSMFLSRNKKNNVYPCKPQFYYIKVGFKGVKIT